MKKIAKISLWVVALFAGLVLIAGLAFYLNFRSVTKKMTPSATAPVNDSVWCVKDKFVNAYIFKGNNGYLMVDAGISKKNFRKELKKIAIKPRDITTILLTHSDGDHVGAMGLFKDAVVYMYTDEKQMIDGTTGKTKYAKTIWKYGQYNLFEGKTTIVLDGLKVTVLPTPGHTPGSVCYIIGDDYLVSGDNLTYTDGKYDHFIERFNMDTPKQIESIKTLPAPESFRYILTGHTGIKKIDK
jgi:glyoxylase-like metal-dependent hydrolase (beta-lactamase superfamily II)